MISTSKIMRIIKSGLTLSGTERAEIEQQSHYSVAPTRFIIKSGSLYKWSDIALGEEICKKALRDLFLCV